MFNFVDDIRGPTSHTHRLPFLVPLHARGPRDSPHRFSDKWQDVSVFHDDGNNRIMFHRSDAVAYRVPLPASARRYITARAHPCSLPCHEGKRRWSCKYHTTLKHSNQTWPSSVMANIRLLQYECHNKVYFSMNLVWDPFCFTIVFVLI